ncbi:DUF4345 domain-containing protein [Sulfitobacter mediterraneus]|uniref:DUF4345 domain-containing protein n=1 Tax=Sulfitobacter mediterraneus TaxID=83219 RepID=UPI0021A290AC|nr:DUF4345 domain-containing protein [Sulfitobacter mediterraneus]UWR12259.1 DUF4345 domain-containing protein [Sulfitobacter mediterraneus]
MIDVSLPKCPARLDERISFEDKPTLFGSPYGVFVTHQTQSEKQKMKTQTLTKIALAVSGVIATGVGVGVLFAPHAFHATAGIMLGEDINLLNEMRSSGGMVLVSGLFILLGAIRAKVAFSALVVSSVLYLSYGLSRLVSLAADGIPSGSMLQILVLELVIGGICAILLQRERASR